MRATSSTAWRFMSAPILTACSEHLRMPQEHPEPRRRFGRLRIGGFDLALRHLCIRCSYRRHTLQAGRLLELSPTDFVSWFGALKLTTESWPSGTPFCATWPSAEIARTAGCTSSGWPVVRRTTIAFGGNQAALRGNFETSRCAYRAGPSHRSTQKIPGRKVRGQVGLPVESSGPCVKSVQRFSTTGESPTVRSDPVASGEK